MNNVITKSIANYINNNSKYYADILTQRMDLVSAGNYGISFIDIYYRCYFGLGLKRLLIIEVTDTITILDGDFDETLYTTTISDNELLDKVIELCDLYSGSITSKNPFNMLCRAFWAAIGDLI